MSGQPWTIGKLARRRADGSRYWSFCIKWNDDGGSHRVSLGTNDRSAAEAKARNFWAGRTLAQVDSIGQIVAAYMETQKGKPGEQRKKDAWKAASPFWGTMRFDSVIPDTDDEPGTAGAYIEWRAMAANTMRNELGLIRKALYWAKDKRFIADVPKIKLPPMPESEVDHLTKAEFRRFLAGCVAPHVKLFAQLAVTTGARSTALLELPWVRVDLDRRIINLNPAGRIQSENKRRATIPINDRLYPLLVESKEAAMTPFVIETGGQRIKSIKKGVAAAAIRSKVHCTPHMFRHSAAVWMAEARTPMSEIAAYLGHRNTAVTERVYARFHPDYLRRAAKALNW